MDNFKLNEAFVEAKKRGKKTKKIDLAKVLWTNSTEKTAHTNFSNLANGKTKKIDIAAVPVICKELGVTADYLFGLAQEPSRGEEFEALRAKIIEHLDRLGDEASRMRDTI